MRKLRLDRARHRLLLQRQLSQLGTLVTLCERARPNKTTPRQEATWAVRDDQLPALARTAAISSLRQCVTRYLLELDLGAGLFELLLHVLGLGLVDAFLELPWERLRRGPWLL